MHVTSVHYTRRKVYYRLGNMVDSVSLTAAGARIIRGRHFAARRLAFPTVLKILFAVYVTHLSATGGSNSTSSPADSAPTIDSTPLLAPWDTETAPSVEKDSTTQLLTELGVLDATTEQVPETPDPEALQTTRSESSQSVFTTSTETNFLSTSPDENVATSTSEGGAAPGRESPKASTTVADIVRPTYLLPTPVIDPSRVQVTPEAISLCLVEPVGPEGSVTYSLITESNLDGTRMWNRSHDLVNRTTVCLRRQGLASGVPYAVHIFARDDDLGRAWSDIMNVTTALSKLDISLDPTLELLDGNRTRVTIDWSFIRNLTHVEKFIFSYNQTDNYPGGFQQYEPRTLSGTTRSVTLMGIFPGASYDLSLQGFSGPQSTTVLRRWIPETEPPSHLTPVTITASTMELTWIFPPHTPPPLVRHFMVSYSVIGSPLMMRHVESIYRWTNDTRILLDGLQPDTKYEVNVSTISINSRPSYPRTIVQETGIASPRIIDTTATSTSFSLTWGPQLGRYHHIVTCTTCPVPQQAIEPEKSTATFEGLLSGNEYNGTLVAVKESGARSDPTPYKRLTYPVGPSVVRVTLPTMYGTELEVSWRPDICRGCIVDHYTTSLWISKTSRQVMWKESNCLTGVCRLSYIHLTPGEEYHVEVNAVRMGLLSQLPVSSQVIRTNPATPGPITFPKVTYSQITIAWRPSEGVVDKYVIGLCQADGGPPTTDCSMFTIEVNSSITEFKCIELKPSTRYNITLKARSGELYSPVRWVIQATTSHYPQVDSRPPKAPSNSDITPYTFPVTFDTNYFDNSNGAILYYTVLVAEFSAVSHAKLPMYGNLSEGMKTRTWAKAIGLETIQRYQIAERYSYQDLITDTGKRAAYAKKTIIIGEDECSEDEKNVYCNGPLKDNKIYVYQFRAFTATGYADTPFSRHVALPEDNSGVVAAISVVLILLFIVVLVLIAVIMGRRFRGNYGKYMAAKSMEPLPVGMMNRASTSRRCSRPVRLTDFCHDFQVMNAHCHYGFSQEYESVMKVGRKLTTNAAVLAANVSKNRYTNILPFDRTRVMLSPIDDVEGSDYINANYISGYDSPREYVACQGPLPGTVDDMWRMIWEQNVATIVMLTQLVEKSTVKCDQYWEDDNTPYLHGEIQVTLTKTEELEHWTIRDFNLEMNDTTKKVQQYHYLAWPDHGVPDSSTALLKFIRTVREQIPNNGTPTVVHCSAGVGRTGTFICLDRLMRHIEEYNYVDILSVVCDMRTHRSYMVQTEQQYVFIHKSVLDILEEKGIAPKRLPSISSIDTNDIASTRQGSDASVIKHHSATGNEKDVVVFRQDVLNDDDDNDDEDDEINKRHSTYSMGSPKRSLIEDADSDRSSSPKRGSSNGSVKKLHDPFKADVKEETLV